MKYFTAMLLLLASAASFSQALVTPTDRVVNGVRIRAAATTQSEEIGKLLPNETAEFLGEVPRWYRINHAVHGEGFVSKGWSRVVTPGEAGSAATFDVYVVDVATGLAIFVRGKDFSLVYDAGSNDDLSGTTDGASF